MGRYKEDYNEQYFKVDFSTICNDKLNFTSKIIYCYIKNYWNSGLFFYCSNKQISTFFNLSIKTINNALNELKKHNLIQCLYKTSENNQTIRVIVKPTKKEVKSDLEKLFNSVYNSMVEYYPQNDGGIK